MWSLRGIEHWMNLGYDPDLLQIVKISLTVPPSHTHFFRDLILSDHTVGDMTHHTEITTRGTELLCDYFGSFLTHNLAIEKEIADALFVSVSAHQIVIFRNTSYRQI